MDNFIELIKNFDFLQLISTSVVFFVITREWRKETKEETASIREEIKNQSLRIDEHAKRTDRLYEMFIDLLKERNERQ